MDPLERTVENEAVEREAQEARATSASRDAQGGDPLSTPQQDPDLEAMRKKMIAENTRKTQQLAELQRQYDQQLQALTAERQMLASSRQQGQEGSKQDESWLDQFDPDLRQQIAGDPNLQRFVGGIQKASESKISKLEELVEKQSKNIDKLSTDLQQQRARNFQTRAAEQAQTLSQEYEGLLTSDEAQEIVKTAFEHELDLKQALMLRAPDVYDEKIKRDAQKAARDQLNTEYGAALEGFEDVANSEPVNYESPVNSKTGKLRPMNETAKKVLGRGGYIGAMREGAQ